MAIGSRFGVALVLSATWLVWMVPNARAQDGSRWSTPAEAEAAITDALAEPIEIECIDQPLRDVVDFLKDYHDIEIQIDDRALEDSGIQPDTPITQNLKGVSLRSALRLMLRDLDLTYVIRDEVLLITTSAEAEEILFTRVYPIADLAGDATCRNEFGEQLVTVITRMIEPSSWAEVGGEGVVTTLNLRTGPVLVVSQTYAGHEKVVEFLDSLRGAASLLQANGSAERSGTAPFVANPSKRIPQGGKTKKHGSPPPSDDPFGIPPHDDQGHNHGDPHDHNPFGMIPSKKPAPDPFGANPSKPPSPSDDPFSEK